MISWKRRHLLQALPARLGALIQSVGSLSTVRSPLHLCPQTKAKSKGRRHLIPVYGISSLVRQQKAKAKKRLCMSQSSKTKVASRGVEDSMVRSRYLLLLVAVRGKEGERDPREHYRSLNVNLA